MLVEVADESYIVHLYYMLFFHKKYRMSDSFNAQVPLGTFMHHQKNNRNHHKKNREHCPLHLRLKQSLDSLKSQSHLKGLSQTHSFETTAYVDQKTTSSTQR